MKHCKGNKITYIVKEEFKNPNITKEELSKCINQIMEKIINREINMLR